MEITSEKIRKNISRLKAKIVSDELIKKYYNELPLREDLYNIEQLENHAKSLSEIQETITTPGEDKLLTRLSENEIILIEVYDLLVSTLKKKLRIVPAGEWLIDNFYLIEEQIRIAKHHLPRNYSRELPRLKKGPLEGYPRVYGIAFELIAHSDGLLHRNSLNSFVTACQTLTELKLGELWAIPIMLRLALIENLKRVAVRILIGRKDRDRANYWANKLMDTAQKDPKNVILETAEMAKANPSMTSSFVAELVRCIQGQNPALALSITWLEQRISEQGMTIEQLKHNESQQQAMDQVSVGNSINSLRLLNSINWKEFVEERSVVHSILLNDPGGVYGNMDFATRDRYRHVVERLSRKSRYSEKEISLKTLDMAKSSSELKGENNRTSHVGYYLLGDGISDFKRIIRYQKSIYDYVFKIFEKFPLFFYISAIVIITVSVTVIILWFLYLTGFPLWHMVASGILVLFCSSSLGVALVNWFTTVFIRPDEIPKMDYSKGVLDNCKSIVAIPTIIYNRENVNNLLEKIEITYLSNKDKNIYFALLTDLYDAPKKEMEGDNELLETAKNGIESLNDKYKKEGESIFFLIHRDREWNNAGNNWMGYERKRGKLIELNRILQGKEDKSKNSLIVGNKEILRGIKYVVTLDTDTQAPLDSVKKIIASMSHPLNEAVVDEKKGMVTGGYGMLQPHLAITVSNANETSFVKIFGGETGIDPYTKTVSDVYQDIFREGSFFGKGIYNVSVFMKILSSKFPDNLILSHDLIEGCYLRSGIISDVIFYEKFPASYIEDTSRRHRWIRGDWQISNWLRSHTPDLTSKNKVNAISFLSQWKIFDNLRRSLVPLAMLMLLIFGWTVFSYPLFWSFFVVMVIVIPTLLSIVVDMLKKPEDMSFKMYFESIISSIAIRFTQAGFTLITLPYEAYYSIHAVIVSNFRMYISHRKLLEWKPSGILAMEFKGSFTGFIKSMWFAPFLALSLIIYMLLYIKVALFSSWLILGFWLVSPVVAWWLSNPVSKSRPLVSRKQYTYLRFLARKVWNYFETFVGVEDNYLPPDNFQEIPVERIAHRTSPTNIGLYLLSCLAARDFKYITTSQFLEKVEKSFETLGKMERYRGHFYNWYDTLNLKVLPSQYISTVDSGNLVGNLVVLESGLSEISELKIVTSDVFIGIRDTLEVLKKSLESVFDQKKGKDAFKKKINSIIEKIENELNEESDSLKSMYLKLENVRSISKEIMHVLSRTGDNEAKEWARSLEKQCRNFIADLTRFIPWMIMQDYDEIINDEISYVNIPRFKEMKEILNDFDKNVPTIKDIAGIEIKLAGILSEIKKVLGSKETKENQRAKDWLDEFNRLITEASSFAVSIIKRSEKLVLDCNNYADADFEFLYDKSRQLLYIGYNVSARRQDRNYYDLLASESRLISYIAVAKRILPQEHWLSLGRILTTFAGEPALLSWGGSMFEYIMPLLIMPFYEDTLLGKTYRTIVDRHIKYCSSKGVPWGVSESGFNKVDTQFNYQYSSFGVPGLGFRPRLGDELVVAPYASMLALIINPDKACSNLQEMSKQGFEGKYGFYEAVDYTPSRLSSGETKTIIRSFMSHHQSMSFLSLAYVINNKMMQKRFLNNLMLRSATILLEERVPRVVPYYPHYLEGDGFLRTEFDVPLVRTFSYSNTLTPEVHLLSNSRLNVMITNSGGGYTRWKDLAVTRWREDTTCDNTGIFVYIRDLESGEYWSSTYQPVVKEPKRYEAAFLQARADFKRYDNGIETRTEIAVSPEDDIELRRIRLVNHGRTARTIEITTYAEVVLLSQSADELHPVFSNLFIQTHILHEKRAIICTRRPSSEKEKPPFMFHLVSVHGKILGEVYYETDRANFIGRGRSVKNPQAMEGPTEMKNTDGAVLDPIVSIRFVISIEPEQTILFDMVTGVAETRDNAVSLVEKYKDRNLTDRVFALAWTHAQVVLRQINATEVDVQIYGRLASSIIYSNSLWRAIPSTLMKNSRGQSDLWGYGISGDLPIVLLRMNDVSNMELALQLVQAHAYWRMKGLSLDLIIWNEDHSSYRQQLQDQILGMIATGTEAHLVDKPGGIFIKRTDQMSEEDKILMQCVASIIISDNNGSLSNQMERIRITKLPVSLLKPSKPLSLETSKMSLPEKKNLVFFNGFGGWTQDGREYVIIIKPGETTPMPWVNILANPVFGTVLSEGGGSYTWSENAHEFRITPWYNDPIEDKSGEAFYIRDEETGYYWSPTPSPSRAKSMYICRHGFGYSVFECLESGITSELTVFVSAVEPVKYAVLKLKNNTASTKLLSVTYYAELVLGDLRSKNDMHIITEIDPRSGAILARNKYNTEFPNRIVFMDVNETKRNVTGDRSEFIGQNKTISEPSAMKNIKLTGKVGAGLDPCAALQVQVMLAEKQEQEIIFTLGCGKNSDDVKRLIQKTRDSMQAHNELQSVMEYWNRVLGVVCVETPEKGVDILANGWLLYQTLSCRFFGRTGYYQSGGAIGFRDQLQDCLAILYADPSLVREHILRCASHQFKNGDVLHWWHPSVGRGVRTMCSDDLLWLPLVVSHYVDMTEDTGILDEKINFIDGRPLSSGESSYYDKPVKSDERGTIYEHCVRAIKYGVKYGSHGLPLIGSGDWNDGMNLVGAEGKGESVWLAFFLIYLLNQFTKIADVKNDKELKDFLNTEMFKIKDSTEKYSWDGAWYIRAFYDNGNPLGSSKNRECKIDSISQSWAVISGAADRERAKKALESVDKYLVDRENKLIKLLDPAFDKSEQEPGYIKGYVAGVRENGGQYTHAALWVIIAFALMGDSKRAWDLTRLINPINHTTTRNDVLKYKAEPYVVAADIYASQMHMGRAGWTWYTGSSGWFYQMIVHYLLGLKIKADKLWFDLPCIPKEWKSFKIHYRYKNTYYHINVVNKNTGNTVLNLKLDDKEISNKTISMSDDRIEHSVTVEIG